MQMLILILTQQIDDFPSLLIPWQPRNAVAIVSRPASNRAYDNKKYVDVANSETNWCFQNIVQTATAVTATPENYRSNRIYY